MPIFILLVIDRNVEKFREGAGWAGRKGREGNGEGKRGRR
jgi:hypothetical protein